MNEKIEEALTRGVERIYPSKDALVERLATGKPLRVYHGIDPTGPSLHIGHVVQLLKLRELQDMGHHVILLIGDFTATIGDPTGKKSSRKPQTRDEVLNNCKNYGKQAEAVLDMSKVELRFNSEWLSEMNFADVLALASNFTVQQMIERDMFQQRIKDGEPINLQEFLYPAMQGYDTVALGADMEIGGNDQTFNMLAGRTLMAKQGREKFVITLKLITDASGVKMGKTEGNMVSLDDTPANVYGKIMSQPDTLMPAFFESATRISAKEIDDILALSPRDAKMRLAYEVTKTIFGEAEGREAEGRFVATIQNKETPRDIPVVVAISGSLLSEVLLGEKIIKSKGEFARLVKDGGVTVEGEKINDLFYRVDKKLTVRVGKLRFLRIEV